MNNDATYAMRRFFEKNLFDRVFWSLRMNQKCHEILFNIFFFSTTRKAYYLYLVLENQKRKGRIMRILWRMRKAMYWSGLPGKFYGLNFQKMHEMLTGCHFMLCKNLPKRSYTYIHEKKNTKLQRILNLILIFSPLHS